MTNKACRETRFLAAVSFAVCTGVAAGPATAAAPTAIGQSITLTGKFRVMRSDLTTGIGIQEANATGRIIAGPVRRGVNPWWEVDFGSGSDGWVVGVLLATGGVATPTLTFGAAPASINPGGTATLTWSSTTATGCTGTGTGFTGARPASGSVAVQPAVTTAYALTCTGTGGTVSKGVTVTVAGATAPTVALSGSPLTITAGTAATLVWSATNAATCAASGDAGFVGARPLVGSAQVRPPLTTAYTMTCTGVGGVRASSATIAVTTGGGGGGTGGGGAGVGAAFANPDNGNIPDRPKHPIAFPTATGFGKVTSVRSPDAVVYKINSLEDIANPSDGKITYRECALALAVTTPYAIPAGRPRYCVFDVAGAIVMNATAPIKIPKIYIAGQTSPGGIEFRLGSGYAPVNALIEAGRGGDHMIVRHLRTRLGEHVGRTSDNGDPIRMSDVRYQMIDHVSTMFGTDESLDMACTDCTVQWSIIGPNICRNGGHSSTLHCKTFFLKPASNVTVAHNLSQHGEQRGINVAVGTNPALVDNSGQTDIVNNVLYHFIAEQGLISNQFGDVYANYIGNVSLRGPRYNASDGNYFISLYSNGARLPFGFDIYASGNVTPHTRIAGQFGQTINDPFRAQAGLIDHVPVLSTCGLTSSGAQDCTKTGTSVVQNSRPAVAPGNAGLSVEPVQTTSADQAMRDVLAFAGADLCRDGACRDNVDELYVEDVRSCDAAPYLNETAWPSTVATSGGWARLTAGAAKPDGDNDGMPDEWERRFANTNPAVWDANDDRDGDGYPNIEEYLNALAKDDVRYAGLVGTGTGALPAYNCGRPMMVPCATGVCQVP